MQAYNGMEIHLIPAYINLPYFIQFTSGLEFEWKCMEFQYLQIVLFLYNLHSGKHLNGYSCNSSFPCTSVMDGYSKITSNFHESGVVSCGGSHVVTHCGITLRPVSKVC